MKDARRPKEPAGPIVLGAYGAALAGGAVCLVAFGRGASTEELVLYGIGVVVGAGGLWRNWKREER